MNCKMTRCFICEKPMEDLGADRQYCSRICLEHANLKDRVASLERAGDALADAYERFREDPPYWYELSDEALSTWRKLREEKSDK